MPEPIDPIDKAHLTSVSRPSPPIFRYAPSGDLKELVQRYWVPVWSLAEPQNQSTLQYPTCLLVVSNTYARFYGPSRGLSSVTLSGDGWAVGTMLQPAAGYLLSGRPVSAITDTHLNLQDLKNVESAQLEREIVSAMGEDALSPASHRGAITAVEKRLRRFLPVDDDGVEVNHIVDMVRDQPDITRVSQLAAHLAQRGTCGIPNTSTRCASCTTHGDDHSSEWGQIWVSFGTLGRL